MPTPRIPLRATLTLVAVAESCLLAGFVMAGAQPLTSVGWSFDPNARAGAVTTLVVTGLPSLPGLWIAVSPVDAPVGAHRDWAHAPTRHGSVRLRLPDRSEPLEFRLYRDSADRTDLLARSASFVPEPPEAALDAPAEVPAAARFEVFWTGPNRDADMVVLVDPTLTPAEVGSAPTAMGNPLVFDAPWTAGRYELRYLTGVDRDVLTSVEIDVLERDSAGPGDTCTALPSEASLLAAFEAELTAMAGLARIAYGLEDARHIADASVTGSEGFVDASYVLQLTDPVTRDSVTLEGTASARFSWAGCGWTLLNVTY